MQKRSNVFWTTIDVHGEMMYGLWCRLVSTAAVTMGMMWATVAAFVTPYIEKFLHSFLKFTSYKDARNPPLRGQLRGKVCVVTGGASGIGREIVLQLCALGATPVVVDINTTAIKELVAITASKGKEEGWDLQALSSYKIDFSDMSSVRDGALAIKKAHPSIHALVNNAGVGLLPAKPLNADGVHPTFAVNFLGAFLFTRLLEANIAAGGVVVMASSMTHRIAAPRWMRCAGIGDISDGEIAANVETFLDEVSAGKHNYDTYAHSKLALLLTANEFNRRTRAKLEPSGVSSSDAPVAISVDPGSVLSGIWKSSPYMVLRLVQYAGRYSMITPSDGARPTIAAILNRDKHSRLPVPYITPYWIPSLPHLTGLREILDFLLEVTSPPSRIATLVRSIAERWAVLIRSAFFIVFEAGGVYLGGYPAEPTLPNSADIVAEALWRWSDMRIAKYLNIDAILEAH